MNGIYYIIISINKSCRVRIGALGSIFFEKGRYVYVGSAMNGIENRVARHLREEKKMHWHIDYLLASKNAKVERVFVKKTARKAEECITAKKIAAFGAPIPNFGCGDCMCTSHLYKICCDPIISGFSKYVLDR